ncbi:MAG: glycosyltransferase [Phycisphaerae bacterium]|nr:glycosyltransferase [Phycisphaerae bacterium]
MRVLMLSDRSYATRERSMLFRLEVGLADEGVRVVHAVPRGCASAGDGSLSDGGGGKAFAGEEDGSSGPAGAGTSVLYAIEIEHDSTGWPLLRGAAAETLLESIARAVELGGPGPSQPLVDVVHVFARDPATLVFAAEVARRAGSPALLEIGEPDLIETGARLAYRARHGEPEAGGVVLLAADEPMRAAIERVGRSRRWEGSESPLARLVPWGVHATSGVFRERSGQEAGGPDTLALVGLEGNEEELRSVLAGAARLTAGGRELLLFMDSDETSASGAWAMCRRLGLVERVTLVGGLECRRDLLLRAGVLAHPVARGRHRSVTLDAMASGMPVVARRDPMIEWLDDPGLVLHVAEPGGENDWARALDAAMRPDRGAGERIERAFRYVSSRRQAHAHVRAVLDAYADAARRHRGTIGRIGLPSDPRGAGGGGGPGRGSR